MWKLDKPCVHRATGKDVDELVDHCSKLANIDKKSLINLYKNYDDQSGSVTAVQLSSINEAKSKAIKGQYEKTYKDGGLNYIRVELNQDVDLCPNCSIGEVSHLDHFMPRSEFNALAVCRLNLVPSCSICNGKKNDDDYTKYIHPYYETFPKKPFLKATITIIANKLVTTFYFDKAVINKSLESKLYHQANIIELWDRLSKSANSFICDQLGGCSATDIGQAEVWLEDRYKWHVYKYGQNDWRTATIKGIIDSNLLSMNVIDGYRNLPNKFNNGAGV